MGARPYMAGCPEICSRFDIYDMSEKYSSICSFFSGTKKAGRDTGFPVSSARLCWLSCQTLCLLGTLFFTCFPSAITIPLICRHLGHLIARMILPYVPGLMSKTLHPHIGHSHFSSSFTIRLPFPILFVRTNVCSCFVSYHVLALIAIAFFQKNICPEKNRAALKLPGYLCAVIFWSRW